MTRCLQIAAAFTTATQRQEALTAQETEGEHCIERFAATQWTIKGLEDASWNSLLPLGLLVSTF
jgi:hypothetical protein